VRRILGESLPAGTGWSFTFGTVVVFALLVELVSGLGLALYYAPTPDHAWDSIRFIATEVRAGSFLLGLHYWAMRVIVVVLGLHLGRVVLMGSYRPPRHANWVVGVGLFLIVMAFAITGLLLRWDQSAYWATVVRIGIARLTPVVGNEVAAIMRGGADIGALTLTRWYAVHALVLPVVLIAFVAAHLLLRVRDGLSGPVRTRTGPQETYFPHQAGRDLAVIALVAGVLAVLAWHGMAPLEAPADPTATDYVPRPEWYFAWLFQFVKYFPGRLEALGAIIIPGLALLLFIFLPWLDRGSTRHWRERRAILLAFGLLSAGIVLLTTYGSRDTVARPGPAWTIRELAGAALIQSDRCARCHSDTGIAAPIEAGRIGRPADWLAGHIADPEMIAPGLRPAPATNDRDNAAILAALARLHAGPAPAAASVTPQVAVLFNRHCLSCHLIDGVGGKDGPDLSHVGRKLDDTRIAAQITNAKAVDPKAKMPVFEGKLTPDDIHVLAVWLASRRD
jgi:ubiquinol-cytochrome c reductase cytochrome b subunit